MMLLLELLVRWFYWFIYWLFYWLMYWLSYWLIREEMDFWSEFRDWLGDGHLYCMVCPSHCFLCPCPTIVYKTWYFVNYMRLYISGTCQDTVARLWIVHCFENSNQYVIDQNLMMLDDCWGQFLWNTLHTYSFCKKSPLWVFDEVVFGDDVWISINCY